MGQLYENKEVEERVILVGVSEHDGDDALDSLRELEDLVATAGAVTVGMVIQNRMSIHPGTYVGTGKVEEIRELLLAEDATGIVCDDELSPAQMKNLEDLLHTKVMDRTLIILDIFAARASTSEGKIQVELAQLKYRMTRLTGFGRSMSRLGGGIGTRGPGEKKLEVDRRLIASRVAQLNRELKEVQKHRELTRGRRKSNHMMVAAIVGYTNAGKSTLLNHLTNAEVLEEDKHHLIEAFKSTLEEAKYADLIIHVVDASNPQADKQMQIVYETLQNLGVTGKKIITLFNKQDQVATDEILRDGRADVTLKISAAKDQGLEEVKNLLVDILRESRQYVETVLPYNRLGLLEEMHRLGEMVKEEYTADGIAIKAYLPADILGKIEKD